MDEASLPAVQKAHDLNRWLLRWAMCQDARRAA